MGCLYGLSLGDALGAPFEFRNTKPRFEWDGLLKDEPFVIRFRFSSLTFQPGSVTDDTEMTLALLTSILNSPDGDYSSDDAIKEYMKWANLKNTPLGKNTRALFKGIKTVGGFRKRQAKVEMKSAQSNGSLMRCAPLVLVKDWKNAGDQDTALTNDNPINKQCTDIYLQILRYLIFGDTINLQCDSPVIKKAVMGALNGEVLDVSQNRGWVIHALYVALISVFRARSFEESMDYIATHFMKGDTDTIMSIAGGLIGALMGYDKMMQEERTRINIDKINRYFGRTERPAITPDLIDRLRRFDWEQ